MYKGLIKFTLLDVVTINIYELIYLYTVRTLSEENSVHSVLVTRFVRGMWHGQSIPPE